MSFDVTFLGASGGPVEGSNCAVLIKPRLITYQDIIGAGLLDQVVCVDAGSGLFLLSEAIYADCASRSCAGCSCSDSGSRLLRLYNNSQPLLHYIKAPISHPFAGLLPQFLPFKHANDVLSQVRSYLVTHPHLDHINALAINSAGFTKDHPRVVYGSDQTVEALHKHIFNGVIWPRMDNFGILLLEERSYWHEFDINGGAYSVTMFDLSHGKLIKDDNNGMIPVLANCERLQKALLRALDIDHYLSSAFLITYKASGASLLVFGDFECDAVSKLTKNKRIWASIAPLVGHSLSGIVMECLSCNVVGDNELYGHLMPLHLIRELLVLKEECLAVQKRGLSIQQPLAGLNVVVTHVKECSEGHDPRKTILDQLEQLNVEHGLGVVFSIAFSGVSVVV